MHLKLFTIFQSNLQSSYIKIIKIIYRKVIKSVQIAVLDAYIISLQANTNIYLGPIKNLNMFIVSTHTILV